MDAATLNLLVIVFALTVSTATTFRLFARGDRRSRVNAAVALVVLMLAVSAVSSADSGRNTALFVLEGLTSFARAFGVGAVAGVTCGVLTAAAIDGAGRAFAWVTWLICYVIAAGSLCLFILKPVLSDRLALPRYVESGLSLIRDDVARGFSISVVLTAPCLPTSMAVGPGDEIHVAGLSGLALHAGQVVRLRKGNQDAWHAEAVASYITRPHGICFHDGALYISRAGQFSRAEGGRIVQQSTGAVTKAIDLDGDGVFDHYEDVIADLPGAQLPDGLHQNNGLAFDRVGNMYVTVGAPSDRSPAAHEFAGTILLRRPNGQLEVFARGLRNPYGVVCTPDGAVFCTDNDSNVNASGDALFHVKRGAHLGHPYTALGDAVEVTGFTPPILRDTHTMAGLTFVPKGKLPAGFDNCLYVASYSEDSIKRVRLDRRGDRYEARMDVFAHVPKAVDIVFVESERALYACSHDTRQIFRIAAE